MEQKYLAKFVIIIGLLVPVRVLAVVTSLDSSFADNGIFTANADSNRSAQKLIMKRNGKLLVVGNANATASSIFQISANGLIDTSYGTNGYQTVLGPEKIGDALLGGDESLTLVGGGSGLSDQDVKVSKLNSVGAAFPGFSAFNQDYEDDDFVGQALALQDGSFLVFVVNDVAWNSSNLLVIKFDPNGSLDTSFGTNGVFTSGLDKTFSDISQVTRQPDGKILLGGINRGVNTTLFGTSLVFARLNEDLSVDTSFGNNGSFNHFEFHRHGWPGLVNSLALQDDGKILFTGLVNAVMTLGRLNADGTWDTSFGPSASDGRVNLLIRGSGQKIIQRSYGKIQMLATKFGPEKGNDDGIVFLQFNEDGSLDPSFNGDGIFEHNGFILAGGTDFDTDLMNTTADIILGTDGYYVSATVKTGDDDTHTPIVMKFTDLSFSGDYDQDGISDGYEYRHNLYPTWNIDAAFDNDGDGLTNLQEYTYKTDPNKVDTDGDGISDLDEINASSNPNLGPCLGYLCGSSYRGWKLKLLKI